MSALRAATARFPGAAPLPARAGAGVAEQPAAVPARWLILLAFAAVYLIWGSTYLAIRVAIESLPPLLMAGGRFVLAGAVLYVVTRACGAARPTWAQVRAASLIGVLLVSVANGGVVWAEQWIPSGLTAVIVSTMPLWMALLNWHSGDGSRPGIGTWAGLAVGLGGVALLAAPWQAGGTVPPGPALLLLCTSATWAIGSIYARRAPLPESAFLTTGLELVAGGVALLLAGLAMGEAASFHAELATARSLWALGYLVAVGSLVGFTAFVFLLKHADPTRVATYAYVNPVVALFLGWLLLGEALTPRVLFASGLILGAVALIVASRARQ